MNIFSRYLSLWVGLCMAAGIGLGQLFPQLFQRIGGIEVANINLPIAALVWLMIVPMLLRIDFAALPAVKKHWRGVGITLLINWGIKPFSMALLGWFFVKHLFAPLLPPEQLDAYVAGLILLAAAPCTAMVFVWSNLTRGDPLFTLSQVALNDAIMVFAFAPLVGLLLGLSAITVPWSTLLLSVALYILVPLVIAQWLRAAALRRSATAFANLLARLEPLSIAALLGTLILLFALQGRQVVAQPLVIALLAVPITVQVVFTSLLAYLMNRYAGEAHCVAAPSALIGASNFFELAVATAIAVFGFDSGAALATVVGVLVEVPLMLAAVALINRSKNWYEEHTEILAPEHSSP